MHVINCLQSHFCLILCTVFLELQVSKKYSSITFEHVPHTAACHRVEGQATGWYETVQELGARDNVRSSRAFRFGLPSIAINIHMVFLILIGKLLLLNHRPAS